MKVGCVYVFYFLLFSSRVLLLLLVYSQSLKRDFDLEVEVRFNVVDI